MTDDEKPPVTVTVTAVLADCFGPNLNGDAYTPEALHAMHLQLRAQLAARGPLPVYLNFTERVVGQLLECEWLPDAGQLTGAAHVDLAAARRTLPQFPETPELALEVQTRYSQCSHCGKLLYSLSDIPCAGAHHVIGVNAIQQVVSVGVVEHGAFTREPGEPTVEVEAQNQPDDWPYPEAHTDDGIDES